MGFESQTDVQRTQTDPSALGEVDGIVDERVSFGGKNTGIQGFVYLFIYLFRFVSVSFASHQVEDASWGPDSVLDAC